jgi:hypothetical protein
VQRKVEIPRNVKVQSKHLGLTESQIKDALEMPEAQRLVPDGLLQARRRIDDTRTLVVTYLERWDFKKRFWKVVDIGIVR